MDLTQSLLKAKDNIERAKDIAIVTHEKPTADSLGSSLALYQGLLSLGKKAVVVCPDPVTVGLSYFVDVNKIRNQFGQKNFIISLDYIDGSIEKVSYNIDRDKFNLVIEPRAGFEPITGDKVHFSETNSKPDLIISIDTIHLGGLKKLYESEKEMFASTTIINLDHHQNNSNYGQINLVDPDSATTIEITAALLSSLGVKLTPDIASNMLNSLYDSTDNFQSEFVNSRTFELASACIRAGGKRFTKSVTQTPVLSQDQTAPAHLKFNEEKPDSSVAPSVTPDLPQQLRSDALQKPQKDQSKKSTAPEDWLRPKIFKSSNNSNIQ